MFDEGDRAAFRAADEAREMADTPGWQSLVRWIDALIRMDADAIEKGARSWDEYQQAVGRIKSLRMVLERPVELTKKTRDTGDMYE